MTFHKQLPIHLCHVIVATLGQISPETATVFQLLQCSFVTFWSWVILPILVQKTFKREGRRRKRRVLAYHASARTFSWRLSSALWTSSLSSFLGLCTDYKIRCYPLCEPRMVLADFGLVSMAGSPRYITVLSSSIGF